MSSISMPVRNPRTGLNDYQIKVCQAEDIASVAASLREHQLQWRAMTVDDRVQILKDWRQVLLVHRQAIVDALSTDTGRYQETVLEFNTVLGFIDRWANQAPGLLLAGSDRPSSIAHLSILPDYEPYSLVGVISPWNFPLLLAMIDAIPALLCGCSVLIKPSEITPRFIAPLMETIRQVPALAKVLSFITGDGTTGAALLPCVDMVVFTGSVATGRKVGEAAAKLFIPAFLELGGKDPAIVCEDADIERTAAALTWGGISNAGQSCLSIERVYVAEAIYAPFVSALTRHVAALELNTAQIDRGDIGPIIAERQAAILQAHFGDAQAKGAILRCGGTVKKIGGGIWCEPSVITDVNHSMKVMSEESFGPILPVMSFATEQEAISLANDSKFGLSAAVFSADKQRAIAIARQLQAGAVSINDCALTAIMHEGEKQSFKLSGLGGSRMGPAAIYRFVRKKALLINGDGSWDPWWFAADKKISTTDK